VAEYPDLLEENFTLESELLKKEDSIAYLQKTLAELKKHSEEQADKLNHQSEDIADLTTQVDRLTLMLEDSTQKVADLKEVKEVQGDLIDKLESKLKAV
jgi:chromosome segregation ATPase